RRGAVHELRLQGAEVLGAHDVGGDPGVLLEEQLLGEIEVGHPAAAAAVEDEGGELTVAEPERVLGARRRVARTTVGAAGPGPGGRTGGGAGGESADAENTGETQEGATGGRGSAGTERSRHGGPFDVRRVTSSAWRPLMTGR